MTEPLLGVAGLAARRGRPQILRGIDLKALPEACSHQPAPTAPGSTLVGAIAGMYPPAEGRVRLAGRDVTGWPPERMLPLRVCLVPERRQIWSALTLEEHLILGGYRRYRRNRRGVRADIARPLRLFPGWAKCSTGRAAT